MPSAAMAPATRSIEPDNVPSGTVDPSADEKNEPPNVSRRVPSTPLPSLQMCEQLSPGGSHSSPQPALTMPSPHCAPTSTEQSGAQPSQASALPSSHSSAPQRTPSPHPVSSAQADEQPSQSSVLPSSQASPALWKP